MIQGESSETVSLSLSLSLLPMRPRWRIFKNFRFCFIKNLALVSGWWPVGFWHFFLLSAILPCGSQEFPNIVHLDLVLTSSHWHPRITCLLSISRRLDQDGFIEDKTSPPLLSLWPPWRRILFETDVFSLCFKNIQSLAPVHASALAQGSSTEIFSGLLKPNGHARYVSFSSSLLLMGHGPMEWGNDWGKCLGAMIRTVIRAVFRTVMRVVIEQWLGQC